MTRQFVVDRLRKGLRRAGILPGMLEIIDRLVVMALGPQRVEDFFLRVRRRWRKCAFAPSRDHGQNDGNVRSGEG